MKKIVDIKIVQRPDRESGIDHIGTYTDEPDAMAIDRKARGDWSPGQFLYFLSAPVYAVRDAAYERAEAFYHSEWSFVGVQAVATIQTGSLLNKITSGGLYGIPSDADDFAEYIAEQVDELRDVLMELGFTKSEIDKAACLEVTV